MVNKFPVSSPSPSYPPPRLYHRPPPTPPPSPPPLVTEPPKDAFLAPLLHLDGEQWMLIGLALLLFCCGGETELILALLYLAL